MALRFFPFRSAFDHSSACVRATTAHTAQKDSELQCASPGTDPQHKKKGGTMASETPTPLCLSRHLLSVTPNGVTSPH